MEQSKLTSEWIQTFNRLGSEGKLNLLYHIMIYLTEKS